MKLWLKQNFCKLSDINIFAFLQIHWHYDSYICHNLNNQASTLKDFGIKCVILMIDWWPNQATWSRPKKLKSQLKRRQLRYICKRITGLFRNFSQHGGVPNSQNQNIPEIIPKSHQSHTKVIPKSSHMLYYVRLCYVICWYIMLYYVISWYIMLYYVMLYYDILCLNRKSSIAHKLIHNRFRIHK